MLQEQIKMIVGLGNPGHIYANTRHNLGFMVVDNLVYQSKIIKRTNTSFGLMVESRISGKKVRLFKPASFINNSGPNIKLAMHKHNIGPTEILVVLDDLNLELGKLRIRLTGSSGGHNGLKSIISSLETISFPRLRIGIGPPTNSGNQIDHVLGIIPDHEHEIISTTIEKACKAITCSLNTNLDSAMDSYN